MARRVSVCRTEQQHLVEQVNSANKQTNTVHEMHAAQNKQASQPSQARARSFLATRQRHHT